MWNDYEPYLSYNVARDYNRPMREEGPFFTDYLYHVNQVYPNFTFEQLDWQETLYPNLAQHKTALIARFNKEYAFREIGQETVSRWFHYLQCRLDEVAEHYDHAYKVVAENNIDVLGVGYTITDELDRTTGSTMGSTDTRSADSKYKDTPSSSTSILNNPTSQTVDTSNESYNSQGTGTQKDKRTTTKDQHDEHLIDEVNYLIDRYKSINNDFIAEFENMFIGVFV